MGGGTVARWGKGERTVQYLVDRACLESFEAEGLGTLADALVGRAARRVETTAAAALAGGDVDGAYVAAYDAYRMAAESLLARQGLRATGGNGSHMAVEDAVAAQFAADIPDFASRRSIGSGGPGTRRSTLTLMRRLLRSRMRHGQLRRRRRL